MWYEIRQIVSGRELQLDIKARINQIRVIGSGTMMKDDYLGHFLPRAPLSSIWWWHGYFMRVITISQSSWDHLPSIHWPECSSASNCQIVASFCRRRCFCNGRSGGHWHCARRLWSNLNALNEFLSNKQSQCDAEEVKVRVVTIF